MAGALKQSNKQHKGLKSKRGQKRSFGPGKVEHVKGEGGGQKLPRSGNDKQDAKALRLSRAADIKKRKNAEILMQKRLGTPQGPPKIVGVICLTYLASLSDAIEMLKAESSWNVSNGSADAPGFILHATYQKHKTRCSFVTAPHTNIESVMEVARIADIIVFVTSAPSSGFGDAIDASGYTAVSALKAAGCPEVLCCVQNLELFSGKPLLDTKKSITRQLNECFWDDVRIGEQQKPDLFSRALCNLPLKSIAWRTSRSYLLSDSVKCSANGGGEDGNGPSVTIAGYLRGCSLALNSLVHIPGCGTGRIVRVRSGRSQFVDTKHSPREKSDVEMCTSNDYANNEDDSLEADHDKQDSLGLEADAEGIVGEQTWPTDAEMTAAMEGMDEGAGRHRRNVPASIPSGMSSYQADWLVNEEGEFDEEEQLKAAAHTDATSGLKLGGGMSLTQAAAGLKRSEGASGSLLEAASAAPMEGQDEDDGDDDFGSVLDAPVLAGTGLAEKQRLRALADTDAQFPDEIDTPDDQKARERFARYRALQSFRASPWHPKENLPTDYSRIFQFENFSGVQRRTAQNLQDIESALASGDVVEDPKYPFAFSLREQSPLAGDEEGLELPDREEESDGDLFLRAGAYIEVVIDGLSEFALGALSHRKTATMFGLLTHENRLSVLHFTLRRHPGYAETIKSKETLVFHTGFRSFQGKPIFSESNLNCDKHKMERFLVDGRFSMASVYGPIIFGQCPLLVFKVLENGQSILVATGSLAKVDPDRIMLKKVVLTGLPLRVRQRAAVVKHMLYDPNDARWFKPAELVTKHGLRGHITSPVGTHGLFKALFSAPISQNDTIMLILYKRVYPKFPESGRVVVL